jgi:hypothetical protein
MENNIFNLAQDAISKLEESNPQMKGFFDRALAGEFKKEGSIEAFLKESFPEDAKGIDELTKTDAFKQQIKDLETQANMFKNIVG